MSIKAHRLYAAIRRQSGMISLGLLLISLGLPASATAQEAGAKPSATGAEIAGQRFQKTLILQEDNIKDRLKLTLSEEPLQTGDRGALNKRDWALTISSATGKKKLVFQDTFPAWATLEHYGYELQAERLRDGAHILLLTALPGINADTPPDAAQFQVAWIRENRKWRRVGTAKYSLLDGGSQFKIITPRGEHRLIRRRPNRSSNFCGVDTVQGKYSPIFEVYEPASDAFVNRVNIDALLDGAKSLTSEAADDDFNPPFLRTWSQWFAASSDRRGGSRQGATIRPLELGDQRFDTVWMEGAEGLGRGEFVSAQINDAIELSSVRIVTGLGTNEDTLAAFARPSQVLLALSDGSRFVVDLEDVPLESVNAGHGVVVKLPEPVKTNCMSVMLLESTPGQPIKSQPDWATETVVIAQITPYSSLHLANPEQTAKQIVARIASEPDGRTRARIAQMALALKTPLSKEVRRAASEGTPVERERIIALIGSLPSNEAASLLIDFLRHTDPGAPEYRAIKRALASLQQHASPGLIEYMRENSIQSPQKRVDLLRLIGRVASTDELVQLIDQLGQGTLAERNERIRALSAGKYPMIEPLLVHASENPGVVAGYDAIQALNLLGHRLHYRDQGELPRPELYKEILAAADKRRTRLRILELAKYFHVPGFVEIIQPKYISDPDPMTRRASVQALSRNPAPEARDILVAALKDESPDVRIAAIGALSERSDLAQDLEAVIEYSQTERWKAGLQRAFIILAKSSDPRAIQRFQTLFAEEPNSDTALLAARALRRAEGHLDAQIAERIIRDPSVNVALRLEMFNLLGLDISQSGEDFLLGIFRAQGWEQLFEDPKAQHIARQRVFMTLGRRRNLEARAAMLELAASSTSPEIQQISLRALAFYKDLELLETLEKIRETSEPKKQNLIDETITMIERRRTLERIKDGIDDVGD
ncbi:HEAT repeat domain-containing protein [Bradymonas sediminis]|uniref:NAD glycohydrolase translocation F5/8 type C domain-containing protein n=1 Tax=Bradymonas sediminis TaxID=1548548 RepID=A0A2Z4FHZ9_9DELT|nr:HEAT repeat domain-containing protein [Bradymonas sediminis]AWV88415.1 hypothetical protein DN745_03260 [Bradymonas sediminis]TDP77544.1 HEAT repeat protein [Bradymonas sediminis]